jgi:uncharacterized protein (TIGR03067 family)
MRVYAFMAAAVVIVLTTEAGNLRAGPNKETEAERIARLLKQLGDDDFAKREAATKELDGIGEPALPALCKAAASTDDLEIRRRAEKIVQDFAARRLAVAAKKEIAKLQGAWYSTSTEEGGVRQSGENKANRHLFSGDQWTYEDGGAVVQAGTIRIVEVGDKRVQIDFLITEGFRKGDTWVGLYERSGDELKWCGSYPGQGQARPTTLATKPGDDYFLRSLRREKK